MIDIVKEDPSHRPARDALLAEAFNGLDRTRTSARLREGRKPADGLALVALDNHELVGTIRLWHVRAGAAHPALLLGPVAVSMKRRGEGIGSALINAALAQARILGHKAVILMGDPDYYARFGFSAAPTDALVMPGPFEKHRLLGLELQPGGLAGAAGLIIATGAKLDRGPKDRGPGRDWVRRPMRLRAA